MNENGWMDFDTWHKNFKENNLGPFRDWKIHDLLEFYRIKQENSVLVNTVTILLIIIYCIVFIDILKCSNEM